MSDSRKKTPISGNTTAASEKLWKRQAHRRARRLERAVTAELALDPDAFEDTVFDDLREVSDVWDAPKDGKKWHAITGSADLAAALRK